MTGIYLHLDIGSKSFSGNVPGLLSLAATCLILTEHEVPPQTSQVATMVAAGVVFSVFLAIAAIIDAIPSRALAGDRLIGTSILSVTGSMSLRRFDSDRAERRAMLAGLSLALLIAAIALSSAYHLRNASTPGASVAFVLALLVGGLCCIRLCPIQSLPGGLAAKWSFSLLASDEDGASGAARFLSYWSSIVVALAGFIIMANPGRWGPWGLAALIAGIDCALVTQWHGNRERWAMKASARSLESIRFSRLPTVPHAAPISELFSIFAVEGNRATVVVTDDHGQPCGLIQLRHLKNAARAGRTMQPDQLMLTLSEVPEFACESSILDAAMSLERRGISALFTQCGEGKRRVISLDELMRLGETAD